MTTNYLWTPPAVQSLPVRGSEQRLPIHRLFFVGRNYHAHAVEMGRPVDKSVERPFYFTKAPSTLVESGATVAYPPETGNYHFEMELVVAIGKPGFRIAAEEAHEYIYGYACGLDAVNVTVTKLRFHMSATAVAGDAGWTEIALQTPRRINIAQLNNGAVSALGTAALLPGHYAQARVVLDQNAANGTVNSVIAAGTEQALLTQTAANDGVAITMPNGLDVVNGKAVNLVANFDACHSVMPSASGHLLRPAIDMVPTEKNGIDGFVDKAILGSNVRISAQQNGVVIRSTAPDATTGEFLLARLAPGSYDLVVTADGRSAAVVAGVKIGDAVSIVAVNSASTPIAPVSAATGVIDAKLALEPVSAVQAPFGSALQAFVNGPQVSMRERMAVLGSGLVHFDKLSLGLPSLAIWQAGQPLTWTVQAAVTQGASVYTVSSSAPNYVTLSTLAMTAK